MLMKFMWKTGAFACLMREQQGGSVLRPEMGGENGRKGLFDACTCVFGFVCA